jgi:hypothetical protein
MREGVNYQGGKSTYAKSLGFIFAIVLAISLLPSISFAESGSRSGSFEDIHPSAQTNGSIVVVSEEETDVTGTFTQNTLLSIRTAARY